MKTARIVNEAFKMKNYTLHVHPALREGCSNPDCISPIYNASFTAEEKREAELKIERETQPGPEDETKPTTFEWIEKEKRG